MTGPSDPPQAREKRNTAPDPRRLEKERIRLADQLRLSKDVVEVSATGLDVLTALLILEVVLLPFSFIVGTDVYPLVLYALAITAGCFGLFFAANVLGERLARDHGSRLRAVEAALAEAGGARPPRPR